jgi:hypothetical protein
MIPADQLKTLTSFSAPALTRAARDGGYEGPAFASTEFLGITNGGQFCYTALFLRDAKTGEVGRTKVFLTYDPTRARVSADCELTSGA